MSLKSMSYLFLLLGVMASKGYGSCPFFSNGASPAVLRHQSRYLKCADAYGGDMAYLAGNAYTEDECISYCYTYRNTKDPLINAVTYEPGDAMYGIKSLCYCSSIQNDTDIVLGGPTFQTCILENKCQDQLDIVVLLDSSSSIGPEKFAEVKEFFKGLASKFHISMDTVRIAAARFNRKTYKLWDFNAHNSLAELYTSIDEINYDGKGTHTGKALRFVRNQMLRGYAGSRHGVQKIVVVVTDGKAQDDVISAANLLKAEGALISVVAIGDVHHDQVYSIASEPSEEFVTTMNDYNALSHVVHGVSANMELCHVCSLNPVIDLLFVVDSSSSIGQDNFDTVKKFLSKMVQSFPIGRHSTQVGVIRYNDDVDERFTLGQYSNEINVINAINQIPYEGKGTLTGQALWFTATESLSPLSGRRLGVPAVVVVITDGKAQGELLSSASYLKQKANVIVVGINGVHKWQANVIASDHEFSIFQLPDFNGLNQVTDTLKDAICASASVGIYEK